MMFPQVLKANTDRIRKGGRLPMLAPAASRDRAYPKLHHVFAADKAAAPI
jgi:hypothetical protein